MTLVLIALTAMMRPVLVDPDLALRAAREAVAAWLAKGETDLLAIGQIVAFSVTVLDTQRLSLQSDVPPAMVIKLRGSANSATRLVCALSERLAQARTAVAAPAAAAPPPESRMTEAHWAVAMRRRAAAMAAEQPTATPEKFVENAMWIDACNIVADEIAPRPPGRTGPENFPELRAMFKAENPDFPIDRLRAGRAGVT
jgi:hypothetical protein